jgi:molybdopterin guanine dinucleotide-containing S/N-oxide reductase-like protein
MPTVQKIVAESVVKRVTCSLDCPDSCGILATVKDGLVVKITGNPEHPVTRGFLCGKVTKYLDRVYATDRLLYPMRRKAGLPKGSLPQGREAEAFQRISWDEALDTIATQLWRVSAEHGPESVLPYSYAGTIGKLGFGSMDRRFFHRMGASQLDRTICSSAGSEAVSLVYGRRLITPPQEFAYAKLIVAWGANVHGNNIHLWPFIEQARRNGAKLIVIDPYATRTAKLADWHIPVRPGTDTALALGLMQVMLREGLQDSAYIAECTHGFDVLRERVMTKEYAPERVAGITGIAADDIVKLARMIATTKATAIRMNYGVQRAEHGGTAARTIAMLPLLTGAWKYRGGGFALSSSGAFSFNSAGLEMPELMQASPLGRTSRVVNMSQLGHALTELGDDPEDGPRVHALFVYNSNPGAVAPNQNAVLRGMRRDDLFTVVHDQFFTDTADYADIVLPAPSFLEQTDVQGAYGHYFVQLSEKVMDPLGEARSNVRVFGELAQRMGFTEECFRATEDDLVDLALKSDHLWMQGITRERLQSDGPVELNLPRNPAGEFLPFSDASWFQTPSGRGEFYSETLAKRGLDPLPAWVPNVESRHGEGARSFPLEMLPRKADNWMNSTFANSETHRALEKVTLDVLEMHRDDAEARGIAEGDTVRVENARGRVELRAQISNSLPTGVVAARLGWNKLARDGQGVNVLTSERLTDIGDGATFYSTMVEVVRI